MNRILKVLEVKSGYNEHTIEVTLLNDMGMFKNIVPKTSKNKMIKKGNLVKVKYYVNIYSTNVSNVEFYSSK